MNRARANLLDGSAWDVGFETPTKCPICHQGIDARLSQTFCLALNEAGRPSLLEIVFRCPRRECGRTFIAQYDAPFAGAANQTDPKWWGQPHCVPGTFLGQSFASNIQAVSPTFVEIYQQSEQAEHDGLSQISGPGYRKALEFLIKDYVKSIPSNESETESIEKLQLGPCIGKYVTDPKLKSCAKRAAWLGNDETHYIKKWESKDISDLKLLVELTVHWVSAEILTRELEQSMPESGPPTQQVANAAE